MRSIPGLILLAVTGAALAGCQLPVACPAIGSIPGIRITVDAELSPSIRTLTLKVCQNGSCSAYPVSLQPGSATTPEPCVPVCAATASPCTAAVCAATVNPDGSLTGFVDVPALTVDPATITATATTRAGALPERTITVRPAVSYPFGRECGASSPAAALLLSPAALTAEPGS